MVIPNFDPSLDPEASALTERLPPFRIRKTILSYCLKQAGNL